MSVCPAGELTLFYQSAVASDIIGTAPKGYLVKNVPCSEIAASNSRMKRFIHWQLTTSKSVGHFFTGDKNSQDVIKLGMHQILCNNMESKGHLFVPFDL